MRKLEQREDVKCILGQLCVGSRPEVGAAGGDLEKKASNARFGKKSFQRTLEASGTISPHYIPEYRPSRSNRVGYSAKALLPSSGDYYLIRWPTVVTRQPYMNKQELRVLPVDYT